MPSLALVLPRITAFLSALARPAYNSPRAYSLVFEYRASVHLLISDISSRASLRSTAVHLVLRFAA